MNIRKISEGDFEAWLEMRKALWPEQADDHQGDISDFFNKKSIDIEEVLVVCKDEWVVGFLEMNIRNFAVGSRYAKVPYVEAWYVREAYRSQGYGRALMEAAEQWSKARGYCEIASDTTTDNERSIRLHKQLGYRETERFVCFLKQL
jgi:aminoglycoside 6'-N-acetyltransferase I